MKDMDIFLGDFRTIITNFKDNNRKGIPLCAAENIMSDFARLPLKSELQEKYIMGGTIT